MSGGRGERGGMRDGSTVMVRARIIPVSEARSLPSPALRATPRTCWCLRCSLYAEGGEAGNILKLPLNREACINLINKFMQHPVGQVLAARRGTPVSYE